MIHRDFLLKKVLTPWKRSAYDVPTVETKPGSYNVDLIRDDMALKGWLPTDLAKQADVSDMTISRFLNGEVQTPPTAKKIADALGRPVKRYYVPRESVAS